MDSGNDIVMFFTIPVVIDIFLSCLQNYLISDISLFCQKYSGFQDIQGITKISISKFGNEKNMFIRQLQVRMFLEDQRELFFYERKNFFI